MLDFFPMILISVVFITCFTCMGRRGRKEEGDPKKLRVN
jgi:hypothetical protein